MTIPHIRILSIFLFIFYCNTCLCDDFRFSNESSYDVCFTPGKDCSAVIIKEIDKAKKQILVQAYSFTDYHIADALIRAKHRNVDVDVIVDKSQKNGKAINYLKHNNISIKIDYLPAIAHNKIIIIDGRIVIGGSYNYSKNASHRNAENVIIIKDSGVAEKYRINWIDRYKKAL
jgi:phosphatidylserine/phosphatidylglycerophosphate/cardiolipin synthase-like enzyme